jgi:putative ABC transport system permease protein
MMRHPYKNKLAFRFLAWFCPSKLYEGIEGDLLEQLAHDVHEVGEKAARRRLAWNVLRFFRPGIILRNRFSFQPTNTVMLGNYFKVASRNILRRKLYSFINAFGLSIGIAFSILICLFIQDERSFEQYHANKDLIYRMHGVEYHERSGEFHKMTQMQLGLAPVMKAELPEVQYATHFCGSSGVMQYNDKIFREEIVYVDADFFRMFSYHLISGNAEQLFKTNDEIVLTAELARKYFGDRNPLGELLVFGQHTLTVTGVMETPPANSRLRYKALIPIQKWRSYSQHNLDHWMNMGFETYVQVHPKTNLANMKVKLDKLTEKYMGGIFEQWQKERKIPQGVKPYEIGFTNLADIHFEKGIGNSDPKYSWILGGIAALILLIACINYVSLALTTSARRRMEVGIRKVAGAHKRQLVYQFSVESVLLAFISMVIGIVLAALFLPAFNTFTGKSIPLQSADIPFLVVASLVITLAVGLMAGSYPAFFLSRFRPSEVLKGGFTARLQAGFAKPLVVLQFMFSAFLIISSVVMYRQMQYIGTKDLGYDQHQLVVIPTNAGRGEDTLRIAERFMHQAQKNPSVISVTSTNFPFAGGDMMNYSIKVNGENRSAAGYLVDPDFIKTMGMEIVQGRDFDAGNGTDETNTVIVNEALVREMKWSDPFQERLKFSRQDTVGSRVIGVVKDFHFLSLKENIGPMFLTIDQHYGRLDYMLVRISSDNIPATVAQLQKDFTAVAPGKPFEYSFMDENVARQYERFNRWMSIMGLSTGFAVLISCLGLFGLAGINAVNRTKEIGIRKVLGADLGSIFMMLNRPFVSLSVIAFIIAAPLSWYVMNEWLANFSFKIDMGWELFAAAMLIGLVVALLAVSYHGIKAALINPAETLKYE